MGTLSGIKVIVFSVVMGASAIAMADDYDLGLMAWSDGDHASAAQHFLRAAGQGSIGARQMLVSMFERGQISDLDDEQRLDWLAQAAASGIPRARFELAKLLEQRAQGKDSGSMQRQALAWYELAAKAGYHPAWIEVARYHERGLAGLDKDQSKAEQFYAIAAAEYLAFSQKGDAEAQNRLGELYEWGKGIKKDMQQAVYWYRKSAGQELAAAEYNLGRVYAEGLGVSRNEMLAVRLIRDAVAHGSVRAKELLAKMEASGQTGVASAR